ncbi:unnamed protein product [Owenia fusiformis]|uniref:Uncharacterized protein n=1 Tax=Owenia fusiformis TaxID=6347 RepID=A0A8J1UB96_OWEFU|nr:unnamed protein product [Owenia fusiformis]
MLIKIDALLKGVPCSSCDTKENARWNCKTCRQAYCNRCLKLHKNIQDAEKHKIEHINANDVCAADPEMTDSFHRKAIVRHYCPNHKKEELIFFCKNDGETVCRNCILLKHRDHKIIAVKDKATEIRNQIGNVLKQGNSNFKRPLTDYVRFIENMMKECKENYDETAKSVHAYFQKIQAKIDAKRDNCLQKLHKNHAFQMKLLETTTSDMSGRLSRFNNERRLLETLKTNTSDVQLSKMSNKLIDTFTAWESNDWQRPYKLITQQITVFANDTQMLQQYMDSISVDVEDIVRGTPMPLFPDEIHHDVQEAEELSSFDTGIGWANDIAIASNEDTIIIEWNKDVATAFDARRYHKLNITCTGPPRSVARINKKEVLIATTTTIGLYDKNYKHMRDIKTFGDIHNIAVNEDNDIAIVENAAKAVIIIDQNGREKMRLDKLKDPIDVLFNINGDIVVYDDGDHELKVYSDTGVLKHKKQHNCDCGEKLFSYRYEKYLLTDMYRHILAKATDGNKKLLLYSRDLSVDKEVLQCDNFIDAFTVQKNGSLAVLIYNSKKLNIYKYIK